MFRNLFLIFAVLVFVFVAFISDLMQPAFGLIPTVVLIGLAVVFLVMAIFVFMDGCDFR